IEELHQEEACAAIPSLGYSLSHNNGRAPQQNYQISPSPHPPACGSLTSLERGEDWNDCLPFFDIFRHTATPSFFSKRARYTRQRPNLNLASQRCAYCTPLLYYLEFRTKNTERFYSPPTSIRTR